MKNYAIITPVFNEVETIRKTIASVFNQTVKPMRWIIVNDNSNDGTEVILSELSEKISWVNVISAKIIKTNDYSSRVVNLFKLGLEHLDVSVEYICKLDADVSFDKNFYNNILEEFDKDTKLGIASGQLTINGISEDIDPRFLPCTRGATKVYRMECLNDIGGLRNFQGWDTLDNVAARAKGWNVLIVNEFFEHLKEEGSRVGSKSYSHFRTGFYNGAIPYYVPFFLIKALSKIFNKPFIIGSIFQIAGFVKGFFFSTLKPFPDYVVKQLHKEQKKVLINYIKEYLNVWNSRHS